MAIALVGAAGAFSAAGAATISPAFGQGTTAGNLLVAWVGADNGSNTITTAQAGWVQAVNKAFGAGSTSQAAIWYKPNCGNTETAPTFTCTAALRMQAQLGEFSGAATTSVVDRTATGSGTASPQVVTTAGVDAQMNELQATAYDWSMTAGTCTTTDTYGANATAINLGNDDSTSTFSHVRFSYAITTANNIADTDSGTNTGVTNVAAVIASFKLGALFHTGTGAGVGASTSTLTEKATFTGLSAGVGGSVATLSPLPMPGWAARISIPNAGVGGGTFYSDTQVLLLL
jgi:hypothetical protein